MTSERSVAKALVVGVDSQIGRTLSTHLRSQGWQVYGTSRRDTRAEQVVFLDLATVREYAELPDTDVAFLCVAETRLARCRAAPETTARVNTEGPVTLARALVRRGAFVVFLSTLAVFDGYTDYHRADEVPNPRSVYGRQKLQAEQELAALGERLAIVRLTKVLVPEMPLIRGWIQALRCGDPIKPFADMVMSPLSLGIVMDVLTEVGRSCASGLFQLSGSRDISYADAALYIAQRLGAEPALIQPIKSSEAGIPPDEVFAHTTLDSSRVAALFGIRPPDPLAIIDETFFSRT